MRQVVWSLALLGVVACGPGGDDTGDTDGSDTDDTDTSDTDTDTGTDLCEVTSPAPTGNHVWIVRPDGECAQSPSHAYTGPFAVAGWSPDGARVRMRVSPTDTWIHAPRSGLDPVVAPAGAISPDWTWVVSSSIDEDEALVYSIARVAGGDEASVTLAVNSEDQGVIWSPDSDALVVNTEHYSTSFGDGPYILTTSLQIVRSYYGVFFEGYAQWSRGASHIASVTATTLDDVTGVWMLPPDGSDPTLALAGPTGALRWVDDERFVVASGYGQPGGMWVGHADGSAADRIWEEADGPLALIDVSAADGTIALRPGALAHEVGLVFVELDGSNRRDIVGPTGWFGSWSPDGQWFGGHAADPETGRQQIYVVREDGTGLTRVTSTTDLAASFVGWSPGSDRLLWFGAPPTP